MFKAQTVLQLDAFIPHKLLGSKFSTMTEIHGKRSTSVRPSEWTQICSKETTNFKLSSFRWDSLTSLPFTANITFVLPSTLQRVHSMTSPIAAWVTCIGSRLDSRNTLERKIWYMEKYGQCMDLTFHAMHQKQQTLSCDQDGSQEGSQLEQCQDWSRSLYLSQEFLGGE